MPPPACVEARAVPRAKAASEAVPRVRKMRKKRKLDESEEGARAESASCAEAVVRDLDACEIHVVTFSAPEWHFDAAEAAMLLKSALAPTHSKSAFSVVSTDTRGAYPRPKPPAPLDPPNPRSPPVFP